jgi:DNA mismatch repair protein MutS2
MDAALVERAKGFLSDESKSLEALLLSLEADQRTLSEAAQEARDKERRLEHLVAEWETAQERIRTEEKSRIRRAGEEALQIVREARRLVEREVREIRESQAGRREVAEAHAALSREIERLERAVEPEPPAPPAAPPRLEPGSAVRLRSLGRQGTLDGGPDAAGRVWVVIDGKRIRVSVADLEAGEEYRPGRRGGAPGGGAVVLRAEEPGELGSLTEVDVRGERAEEARRRVESHLDRAFLEGASPVRIIHGKGTGALRRTVEEILDGHSLVRSFRPGSPEEGGDGVTVVDLAR